MHSLKPCHKAAASWETTAPQHRLGAAQAGGTQVHKQQWEHLGGSHSKMKQQVLPVGQDHRTGAGESSTHSCRAAGDPYTATRSR